MAKLTKAQMKGNTVDEDMARNLDLLAGYDSYSEQVAPILRKAVEERWSVERIYKEFSSFIAARAITIALKEEDSGKALSALKEVLDRSQGKATERVETTHRLEKMADEDLDRMLASLASEDVITKN